MVNNVSILLCVIVAFVIGVIVVLLYRFFQTRESTKPKNRVMNKIEDFYKDQDAPPSLNY